MAKSKQGNSTEVNNLINVFKGLLNDANLELKNFESIDKLAEALKDVVRTSNEYIEASVKNVKDAESALKQAIDMSTKHDLKTEINNQMKDVLSNYTDHLIEQFGSIKEASFAVAETFKGDDGITDTLAKNLTNVYKNGKEFMPTLLLKMLSGDMKSINTEKLSGRISEFMKENGYTESQINNVLNQSTMRGSSYNKEELKVINAKEKDKKLSEYGNEFRSDIEKYKNALRNGSSVEQIFSGDDTIVDSTSDSNSGNSGAPKGKNGSKVMAVFVTGFSDNALAQLSQIEGSGKPKEEEVGGWKGLGRVLIGFGKYLVGAFEQSKFGKLLRGTLSDIVAAAVIWAVRQFGAKNTLIGGAGLLGGFLGAKSLFPLIGKGLMESTTKGGKLLALGRGAGVLGLASASMGVANFVDDKIHGRDAKASGWQAVLGIVSFISAFFGPWGLLISGIASAISIIIGIVKKRNDSEEEKKKDDKFRDALTRGDLVGGVDPYKNPTPNPSGTGLGTGFLGGMITSTYGEERTDDNGNKRNHWALDIGNKEKGKAINAYSLVNGKVVAKGVGDGYGGYVLIRETDKNGELTKRAILVAHIDSVETLKKGSIVKAGQLIGTSSTEKKSNEKSTGPHVHYEAVKEISGSSYQDFIKAKNKENNHINPVDLMKDQKKKDKDSKEVSSFNFTTDSNGNVTSVQIAQLLTSINSTLTQIASKDNIFIQGKDFNPNDVFFGAIV